MKYAKILGLLVVAAATLTVGLVGTASATRVTSPHNSLYTGKIKAVSHSGHVVLHSENAPTAFTVECATSLIEVSVQTHGEGVTASGPVLALSFENCTKGATVVVNKPGTFEIHSHFSCAGCGTLTSSGAEMVVHVPILNIKCIYTTSGTEFGTLTGSTTTGGHATIDTNSQTLARTGGSAFCGTGGFLTGSYTVTTPADLNID